MKRPALLSSTDETGAETTRAMRGVRGVDPLIRSLLAHLPPPGAFWPLKERENWVDLLEGAFKVIYKEAVQEQPHGQADPPRGPLPAA